MSTPINTRDLRLQATSPRVLLVGANYINLTTPTLQFKYGSNNVAQPTQTIVTATPVGVLNGQTVTFTYTGLISTPTISGNTLTVMADNLSGDIATVTASLNFQGINYSNTISLTKIYNQLVVTIQRPLDLISSANDGTNYTLPSTANYIELYNGTVKDTSNIVYGPATTTKNGLTVAVNTTTGQITVSGTSWTSTGESFLLTATKNSVTYSTTYTITKARAGSNGSTGPSGSSAVSGSLTNSAYTVTADNTGYVVSYSNAGGTFNVFDGTTDKTGDASVTYSVFYKSTGLDGTISIASTGVYTISNLTTDTGLATLRAVYTNPTTNVVTTIDKNYSIAKSKAGANGTSITGAAGAASFLITRSANNSGTPSPTELTTFIGRNYPVQGDLATISYNSAQATIAYKYNGSIWEQQAAWITGDLIVSGSINASKISGGTLTSTDSNFNINIGNYAFWNPDAGYVSTGISIKRNVSNFPTISVASLTANYLYQIVSVGTTTNWAAIGNISGSVAVGTYFTATGVAGNGSGTVKRVLSSGISIYDTATWDASNTMAAKFHPSLNIQSEYSSALRISCYAGYNNFNNITAASINGGSYRTLEVAAMSGLAQDCTLAVLNGYGNAIGAKIIAGGASFSTLYVENTSGSTGTAVYGIGSIEATGKFISTANIASTSTTSGSLLVIGGAGISGAVYAGSLYDNGNRVLTTNTLTNSISITNTTVATSTTTGALIVSGGVGITGKLWVNDAINSYANITAYYSSDARLKENIKVISDPIKMIDQISGVYFDWTDDYINRNGGEDGYFIRKHDIGVIAQEVEAVLPEIVATRADGYKAVMYEKLIPLIIEAIKELDRRTK